jgi:SAM-dependent methyltransferase
MIHQSTHSASPAKNMRKSFQFLGVGLRYGLNLMDMVARQQGYWAAARAGSRFAAGEIRKLPRVIRLALEQRNGPTAKKVNPVLYSPEIVTRLSVLKVDMQALSINQDAFYTHVDLGQYPKNYAAGPVDKGGLRDKKLLEYFVSLELLDIQKGEVVIDVASEWSIFPDVLRRLTGAVVYQQDLIYPPGINGQHIGGNAAHMPVPDGFADKLVLHNAFEHFEGSADTEFVLEAWRVLKPGGSLCILPLYLAEEYHILTDPLVGRSDIVWDEGARIIERPWWHNRFGRFYDPESFHQRVLAAATKVGFQPTVYHLTNVRDVVSKSDLHFALMLGKPR